MVIQAGYKLRGILNSSPNIFCSNFSAENIPAVICLKRNRLQTVDAPIFKLKLNAIYRVASNTLQWRSFWELNNTYSKWGVELSREVRVALAQLRLGYCGRLNSYLSRPDSDIPWNYSSYIPSFKVRHRQLLSWV